MPSRSASMSSAPVESAMARVSHRPDRVWTLRPRSSLSAAVLDEVLLPDRQQADHRGHEGDDCRDEENEVEPLGERAAGSDADRRTQTRGERCDDVTDLSCFEA